MNFDELKAKGKSLDYIEGYIDGQGDRLKEEMESLKRRVEEIKKK